VSGTLLPIEPGTRFWGVCLDGHRGEPTAPREAEWWFVTLDPDNGCTFYVSQSNYDMGSLAADALRLVVCPSPDSGAQ